MVIACSVMCRSAPFWRGDGGDSAATYSPSLRSRAPAEDAGDGRRLAKELDPGFNLLDVYIPLTQDLVRRQVTPAAWTKQFLLAGIDALQVTMQVPQQLRRILGDIERGGFEVNLQPASFDPYFERLQQVVNRILIALLAATCTISTAIIVAAYHPAGWDWVAETLFLLALLFAGVFGVYILVTLLRSQRSHRQ